MKSSKKVCIIVPAFNEQDSILSVIHKLQQNFPLFSIVVINDGSEDDTARKAKSTAATLISLPFNLGIGGAVQTGLRYALDHDFDVAVQVDADGQHDPEFLSLLLATAKTTQSDLVIGSRYLKKTNYKTPLMRRIGIWIFSNLIQWTNHHKITDPTSGFRVFNKPAIHFLAHRYPTNFPEPESIVMLLRNKFSIVEVPVEMKDRQAGKSSITTFKSVYFMLSISLSILIESMKPKVTYGANYS